METTTTQTIHVHNDSTSIYH